MMNRWNFVEQAENWVGLKESDGSFKKIIDLYNSHPPLARGYRMQYTDEWCATFVSAVSIACGYTSIIPTECGCGEMVKLLQSLGEWQENDAYIPKAGDLIFYDWKDSGAGDDTGWATHVGIVQSCSGGVIHTIEGNVGEAVVKKSLPLNDRYIRGFGCPKYSDSPIYPMSDKAEPELIWKHLNTYIKNDFGTAGLMGNLYAESALIPNNLQDSFSRKWGISDKDYTNQIDEGHRSFIDSAGYGLAQWTFSTRKERLLQFCRNQDASVGNLEAQLDFLKIELEGDFKGVLTILRNSKSVREASDAVLTKFEQPADQSEKVQVERVNFGQRYYDAYHSESTPQISEIRCSDYADLYDKNLSGTYECITDLYCRTGAGILKKSLTVFKKGLLVQCYGYYSKVLGTKWLLVQGIQNGVKCTGFCSVKNFKKV